MSKLLENKNREFDIVLFGRVTIDLNPIDANCTLDKSLNFQKYLGGSVGNIAIGASRLGLKTALISCVSDDQHGIFLKNYLEKSKVNISNIQTASNGEKIGLTFTEMKSTVESSILMYRENVADLALEPNGSHEEIIKNSNVLLVSGTALAKSPSREAILNAITLAKKHRTQIIFDIDYRPYTWKNELETSIYYNIVAENADVIIGSREEFNLTEKIVNHSKSDLGTSNYYFSKNAKLVIIKHGVKGSFAFTKDGDYYKVSIFPIKLLKSFGGGDAYASALIYGLMKGKTLSEALTLGSAHAAHVVSAHSCSEALMTKKELTDFIEKYKNYLPIVKKNNE